MSEQPVPDAPASAEITTLPVQEEPFTEAIVVGDVIGPPGPSEWRAMREQAIAIAGTDFVPKAMRGKPDEVLACLLTGRELQLGPMASLQGIRIQDGKPAYDAELMRALVRRRGHDIEAIVKNHKECVVWGRRRDTGREAWVRWDLEDARIANLIDSIKDDGLPQARSANGYPMPWEQYPRRMLFARATGELVADLFADVLVGGSYTPEELGVATDWDDPEATERERRGLAFRRIRVAIEQGRVTRDKAAEIGAEFGVPTLADATAEQAEAIASAVEATEPPDPGPEAPQEATEDPSASDGPTEPAVPAAGPEDPEEPVDPGPVDVPLHQAILEVAGANWTPSAEDEAISGDARSERRMTLEAIAAGVALNEWTAVDVRTHAGLPASRKKGGVVALLAAMDLTTLRAASDALEAAAVKAGEQEEGTE